MIRSRLLTLVPVVLLAVGVQQAVADRVLIKETGSTLLYPVFQNWVTDYVSSQPGVQISTAPTGSGEGIAQTISGQVHLGASDAYMSDQEAQHNANIANIPVAIAAQTVNFNLPGMNGAGLKLDGPVLARIYTGKVTTWDAAEIAALNPDTRLPHQPIIPIRRSDASGDTFIFTQFLAFSSNEWDEPVGFGTVVDWPAVAGEKTVQGNKAMIDAIAATPYSVGYIGISFEGSAAKDAVGTASIKNQAGKFLLPTKDTVSAAASQLDPRTPPDERLSLTYAPGDDSYPLVNYEYVMVSLRQSEPDTAAAIRRFLLWVIAIDGGNAAHYLDTVHFIPLPDFIRALSENQINRIRS
jgi:phosphate transport system substrate-binding protein